MTTNSHPAHGPVSLERLHQISEILSKAAAQSDGGNLGYAMADAVKVIDGAIAAFGAEPVGTFRKGPCGYYPSFHEDAVPLYTAPPAQLVNTIDETLIEALRLVQCMLDDYRERNYGHAQEWIRHISAKMDDYSEQHGDDAYSVISAAMLQAGNHTEQHLDMVDHFVDTYKMVAGNSPVIGVDLASGPDRTVEVRYVAPPGYVMVPKEMTDAIGEAIAMQANCCGGIALDIYDAMLAAAPQQEVNRG
nr:hypothetical protein [Citrobacter freundii]EHL6952847.1 hypothetical protein [Citrobacter freundii]